ncbi:alpha-amylase family glycosyl hydrolase [Microbulbifer sp. 2205BS26-8]|uniref:alpha-amylase family glycosyl hydrolase n=1 Tax=Microbulbifer sp. 2205BS26-8 TaxID=3064386 RepID=UPI00273EB0AC|nr:alpha-amylase family glycosyl hydrolase [Microbulbifer sp. 2205BS26-8]MDP5208319.1 alpha-amylase family glycosyl hydrolase [Microbulbifer sp. 2205BS26-8]
MKKLVSMAAALCLTGLGGAGATATEKAMAGAQVDPFWRNASIYFLLPDRFANGDPGNDRAYGRKDDAELLRGFAGGDLRGLLDKLETGYFRDLGVTALWMSPVVLNHTGPVTKRDPLWPAAWVRTTPVCDWNNFAGNVHCALTSNLPDIRTGSEQPVDLPPHLLAKWRREGRLQREQRELDAFFARTGYPRAPKYYIVKWLTDWVREYGVNGFRVDTAKHVEPEIWAVLKREASLALAQWKADNPDKKLDDRSFFMLGEVYHFGVDDFGPTKGRVYDFGDRQVDFFAYGFDSLINMGFAQHAAQSPQAIFSRYSSALHGGALDGLGVLNYLGSHDDHHSFDRERKQPRAAALKLMLAPGAAQIYYGDEIARPMIVKNAGGDASMRSLMNWQDLERKTTQALLDHWRKLGQFRRANLALGAGEHSKLADQPYTFSRTLEGEPPVLVALGVETGKKSLPVYGLFADGTLLKDYYSGTESPVVQGRVHFDTDSDLLLLGVTPERE